MRWMIPLLLGAALTTACATDVEVDGISGPPVTIEARNGAPEAASGEAPDELALAETEPTATPSATSEPLPPVWAALQTACADGEPIGNAAPYLPDQGASPVFAQVEASPGVWETGMGGGSPPLDIVVVEATAERAELVACVHRGLTGEIVNTCFVVIGGENAVISIRAMSWFTEVRTAQTGTVVMTEVIDGDTSCPTGDLGGLVDAGGELEAPLPAGSLLFVVTPLASSAP